MYKTIKDKSKESAHFGVEFSGTLLICFALLGTIVTLPFTYKERKSLLFFLSASAAFAYMFGSI